MLLKTYTPVPRFPAISISGTDCALHCEHCNATYLSGMLNADTPQKLLSLCRNLDTKGAVGVLLSGGSNEMGGMLNLERMLPAIQQIKEETNLILNVHPGLVDDETAYKLHVDFASLEIPSDKSIHDIFGLRLKRDEYLVSYHRLKNAGINVVPHVSVYDGSEHNLLDGIESPETIVVIVFTPTRDTPMVDLPSPTPGMVSTVVMGIRQLFPDTEVSLGCMRTRERNLRNEIERAALESGATRIELPSRATLNDAPALGFSSTVNYDACCALPKNLEDRARTRL